MKTYTMKLIHEDSKECGNTTVSVAVYYPDLGEDGNELPGVYRVSIGDNDKWATLQTGSKELLARAIKRFEDSCDEAEDDYHQSGRAGDDYRLRWQAA